MVVNSLESLGTPAYLYRISKKRGMLEIIKGYARIDRYGKGEFVIKVDRPSGSKYRCLKCSTEEFKVLYSSVWLTLMDHKTACHILAEHFEQKIDALIEEQDRYDSIIGILMRAY